MDPKEIELCVNPWCKDDREYMACPSCSRPKYPDYDTLDWYAQTLLKELREADDN